jgi:hypothetical protein
MKRRALFKFLAAAPLAALPSIAIAEKPRPVLSINDGNNSFTVHCTGEVLIEPFPVGYVPARINGQEYRFPYYAPARTPESYE